MRKQFHLGSVSLALLALAVLAIVACGGGSTAAPTATSTRAVATPTPVPSGTTDGSTTQGEVVTVQITENPYRFVPDKLVFQAGKTYTLVFPGPRRDFHTFTVKDLGIDVLINPGGEEVRAQITPTKKGTFELVCTPHKGLGQVGTVTVQ